MAKKILPPDDPEVLFWAPPDPSFEMPLMLKGQEIVTVDGGKVKKRNPMRELERLKEQITKRVFKQVAAATNYDLSEEELQKLPERDQLTARYAKMPASEVPYGLKMAADIVKAAVEKKASGSGRVNINIGAAVLPPQQPKPSASEVVVIDAAELKGPEDEE